MDSSVVTAWAAMATAIAAIIGPSITAHITTKSAERIKSLESERAIHEKTISCFASKYSALSDNMFLDPYYDFLSSAYELLAYSKDEKIRSMIESVINDLKETKGRSNAKSDSDFLALLNAIPGTL